MFVCPLFTVIHQLQSVKILSDRCPPPPFPQLFTESLPLYVRKPLASVFHIIIQLNLFVWPPLVGNYQKPVLSCSQNTAFDASRKCPPLVSYRDHLLGLGVGLFFGILPPVSDHPRGGIFWQSDQAPFICWSSCSCSLKSLSTYEGFEVGALQNHNKKL